MSTDTATRQQDALDVIQDARNLLDDPSHWIKGSYALDANGDTTPTWPFHGESTEPTCFCLEGAVRYSAYLRAKEGNVYGERYRNAYREALFILRGYSPGRRIIGFNDNLKTTHQDILDLLDRALEAAA